MLHLKNKTLVFKYQKFVIRILVKVGTGRDTATKLGGYHRRTNFWKNTFSKLSTMVTLVKFGCGITFHLLSMLNATFSVIFKHCVTPFVTFEKNHFKIRVRI